MIELIDAAYDAPNGRRLLHAIDLRVEPGEWLVLAGGNGAGKSTLCRLLAGLTPRVTGGFLSGSATLAGHDLRNAPDAALGAAVGVVLDLARQPALGATVWEEIAFGMVCRALPREQIQAATLELAAELGLSELLCAAPGALSGGERLRVAIAAALAPGVQALVLDEPLAFLDPAAMSQVLALLAARRRRGLAIIMAEHRLEALHGYATRLVTLKDGQIVADGPFAAPQAIAPLAPLGASQPRPGPPALEWRAICAELGGRPVLAGVSASVASGQALALCGPNGAGKTTLLRLAKGLAKPSAGHVLAQGRDITASPPWERAATLALVPQHPGRLLHQSTVAAELELGLQAQGSSDPAWVGAIIERCAIGHLLTRPPQRLSAGEQRRVALAALLAPRPKALLLDEPTAGLDTASRQALAALLRWYCAQGGAIALATHEPAWAAACDNLLLLAPRPRLAERLAR